MAKYVCTVCGYVYEGDAAPEICPVCKAPAEKFKLQEGEKVWAAEHVVGVAKGVSEDIVSDLRANFEGECSEVGMYLAMARVAYREGYPEVGSYYEKAAWEEAEDNEDKWFLGVPGIYQNQERVMAIIFGFPEFMPEQVENRFGCWYRFIEE